MKDLKDIILEKRIREWEIECKKIPELYLAVFNDYLEEIAESLADYTKQVRKEVVQEIRNKLKENGLLYTWKGEPKYKTMEELLDQIQGETK